jgi:hypothetical protein
MSHESKTPNFRKGPVFYKKWAVLLQRPFFAGELNRGICRRQARPHDRLVFKLNHGADGQVGSVL